jgi:hypothetical protein
MQIITALVKWCDGVIVTGVNMGTMLSEYDEKQNIQL